MLSQLQDIHAGVYCSPGKESRAVIFETVDTTGFCEW